MSDSTPPPGPTADSVNRSQRSNAKLGIVLFCLYAAFYTVFVMISALAADTMETIVFAGLNLAIVYGFALIIVAVLMALIYGVACKTDGEAQ